MLIRDIGGYSRRSQGGQAVERTWWVLDWRDVVESLHVLRTALFSTWTILPCRKTSELLANEERWNDERVKDNQLELLVSVFPNSRIPQYQRVECLLTKGSSGRPELWLGKSWTPPVNNHPSTSLTRRHTDQKKELNTSICLQTWLLLRHHLQLARHPLSPYHNHQQHRSLQLRPSSTSFHLYPL